MSSDTPHQPRFLPTCREEMKKAGYDELDILLVTGDCYVDHPSFGVAIIGRLLTDCGWKVGIIAQPDWRDPESLKVMGRPRIGVGVTSGNMDSMVCLYTAGRRLRRDDCFSENGEPGKRPPHALPVYCQLVRQAFPGIKVMAGGLEASFRRVVHYDYWQDKLRPSMLIDTKADIFVYGMGERPTPEVFRRFEQDLPLDNIPGTARLLGKKAAEEFDPGEKYVWLPSYEEMLADRDALMTETKTIEREMNYLCGHGLLQKHGDRLVVVEPPLEPLTSAELDRVHELPYARLPHPKYKSRIPAYDAIKDSIQVVRGCPGGCAFCGLVVHQGRAVMSRSEDSVMREVDAISDLSTFKGTISDVGGAAGNIYGSHYDKEKCKSCRRSSCLFPTPCPNYSCTGLEIVKLLRRISEHPAVKHLYINSGIRLDLALRQPEFMRELIEKHVSGHLKVAPEHLSKQVLNYMRKSSAEEFYRFMELFEEISRTCGKEQYIIPLFISNFPGCSAKEMKVVDDFLNQHRWSLQQVQDFIPLPMTMGTAMYYTGKAPDGTPVTVNRGLAERREQIGVLKKKRSFSERRPDNRERFHKGKR
ncbi:MAG: YgiQ family radical SAM protein [Victivallaceae bacterium]|nr:YgiQ family radical SAM protein [Victivallaceae bacterium]